jgi:hypothetical protein
VCVCVCVNVRMLAGAGPLASVPTLVAVHRLLMCVVFSGIRWYFVVIKEACL